MASRSDGRTASAASSSTRPAPTASTIQNLTISGAVANGGDGGTGGGGGAGMGGALFVNTGAT